MTSRASARPSPEAIAKPAPDNRLIAWPYTKRMNAIMEVNQAAAVLVTSAAEARRLGIDPERWVDLWGASDTAEHAWLPSERTCFDDAPSQRLAVRAALASAGLEAGEIGAFDLYSCFPVAVELACEALGLAPDDPRPLTLTGGLAYAGGPGNAYSLHGIAQAMEHVRGQGSPVLVTAVGWHLSKHAAGVYGRGPRSGPALPEPAAERAEPAEPAPEPEGEGRVETFTVLHDREGAPASGIVLGRDARGRRFLAHTPSDRSLLEALESRDSVIGSRGQLEFRGGHARFSPT